MVALLKSAIVAALVAATSPAFGMTWGDFNESAKADARVQKTVTSAANTDLRTPNTKMAVALKTDFITAESALRQVCAPEYDFARASSTAKLQYRQLVQDYKTGQIDYTTTVYGVNYLKAEIKAAAGEAGFGSGMYDATHANASALAQNESASRTQFLAGQYPGSSISCYAGNGVMAWTPAKLVHYKGGKVWRWEETDGMLKTTYTSTGNSVEIVVDSVQMLSVAAELSLPEIGEANYRIVAVNLDSTRTSAEAQKDASVKKNELVKNAAKVYQQSYAEKVDISTFARMVLTDPALRQEIAR